MTRCARHPLTLASPLLVQAVVRDKATRALHSLLLRAPELLPAQLPAVEVALLDRDPIVMTSACQLCLTFAAVRGWPTLAGSPRGGHGPMAQRNGHHRTGQAWAR